MTQAAISEATNVQNSIESAPRSTSIRRERLPLNGVNTPGLFETLGVVKENPGLAEFVFRAKNEWLSATYNRTTFTSFSGAGGEHQHEKVYSAESDHPAVLVGADRAPTPVEHLLHALSSCIMSGIGNISAARGIRLDSVECEIRGDINLLGLLGLNDEVRNGYQSISLSFKIQGDASEEELKGLVEQSRRRSAVYDIVTNGVSVEIQSEVA
jgi:uncharacterized OsmC-like protein